MGQRQFASDGEAQPGLAAWCRAGLAVLVGLNEIKHLRHADNVVAAVGGVARRGDELHDGANAGRRLDPCSIGAALGKARGLAAPLAAPCIVPIEKFRDYIFKPGATHGKDPAQQSSGESIECHL